MDSNERLPGAADVEGLDYPAEFHFRIIVEASQAGVADQLALLVAGYRVTAALAPSRHSSSGRYHAYSVSLRMRDRQELIRFDEAVKQIRGVRLVL